MGKQSSLEKEHNNFTRAKERRPYEVAFNAMEEDNSFFQPEERTSLKAGVNTLEPISSFSNSNSDIVAHRVSLVVLELYKENLIKEKQFQSIAPALFKACGAKMDVGLEQQIYGQMILVGGFDEDLHVGNSMIDMYINIGFWSVGEKCLMKCLIGM
ncbi:hypothetical protein NC653_031487 [Populus alba x Populus x berolinensis]|uniref:Uncharacterized protein n=1 Tax=Populus alba x Populus x berolinensis TaxID=444605 RepID=A0AAD6LYX2_9ROSI|nr:hypothetical protein NC653_031487 [Populus alba x Populus x berolinensis]